MALSLAQKIPQSRRTDVLIALSVANLCFLNLWFLAEEAPSRPLNYLRKAPPDPTFTLAALLDVLVLASVLYFGWRWVKRSGPPWAVKGAQALFLITLSFPLEKLIDRLPQGGGWVTGLFGFALIGTETSLIIGVMLLLLFNHQAVLRVAKLLTFALGLLIPALLLNVAWAWFGERPESAFNDAPTVPRSGAGGHTRVVWMIFDEMDQELAFERRPDSVALPNFDKLRAESFHGERVTPAARFTIIAMPAMIFGKPIRRVILKDSSELTIWPSRESQPVTWDSAESLFAVARQEGLNSAVIGWHHPYCRVLKGQVSSCYWEASGQASEEIETENHCKRLGLIRSMIFLFGWKAEEVLHKARITNGRLARNAVEQSARRHQEQLFLRIRQKALTAITDPSLDLILVHWPTPHPFGIYDRRLGELSLKSSGSYLDNLALADRTLGEVRRALDVAGLADKTHLLVSSDHPFRPEVWRGGTGWADELEQALGGRESSTIPYLVKVAGSNDGVAGLDPFNSLITKDLILSLLHSQIDRNSLVGPWIEARLSSTFGRLQ